MPAEIISLAKASGSFAAKWLPGFVARRWFNKDRLDHKIKIGLREVNPISIGGSPNQLNIYIRISNFSGVDITVDRIILSAWFGQPTAILYNLVPFDVPASSEASDICLSAILSDDVAKRAFDASLPLPGSLVHLYVTAVCKASFRYFIREERIERDGTAARFALSMLPPSAATDV